MYSLQSSNILYELVAIWYDLGNSFLFAYLIDKHDNLERDQAHQKHL